MSFYRENCIKLMSSISSVKGAETYLNLRWYIIIIILEKIINNSYINKVISFSVSLIYWREVDLNKTFQHFATRISGR